MFLRYSRYRWTKHRIYYTRIHVKYLLLYLRRKPTNIYRCMIKNLDFSSWLNDYVSTLLIKCISFLFTSSFLPFHLYEIQRNTILKEISSVFIKWPCNLNLYKISYISSIISFKNILCYTDYKVICHKNNRYFL